MDIYSALLRIVQFTAIFTFLIFFFVVFLPKTLRKKKFKKHFFDSAKVSKDFIILTSGYLFIFSYLFYFNSSPTIFPLYVLGFLFAMVGLIVAVIGRIQLRKLWNPVTNIYNSKQILDTGVFSQIRHPIYFGRFFFFIGVLLMFNLLGLYLAPFYWDFLRNRLIQEEDYLKKRNKKYKRHMDEVSRVIF